MADHLPTSDYDPKSGRETTTDLHDGSMRAGTMVDAYKILSELGQGGCGVVYLAERERPIRGRVALKVIKPGMDSSQVIARFEAERQALALMDHPNVARVFDGGTTDHGRPYFVMEYVKGVPLTEHCDRQKLNIVERLKLFIDVCNAVQHAHQKGIIHRDLKSSNILVMIHGNQAIPKVIDFGLAKAMFQPLTERTLYTEQGQVIGTPEYMSPEQAEMTNQDIDTRTDIYSLGVVLYELLTGSLPFEHEYLRTGGLDHIRRVIREEEPQTPSARIASIDGMGVTKLTQTHQIALRDLKRELRGDLDWITLRAMDKDRMRRYETANGLAADILRYLNHEPVVARPPTSWYRFQKMARRNKAVFAASVVMIATLAIGLAAATWGYLEADRQRDIADVERDKAVAAQDLAEQEQARAEAAQTEAKRQQHAAEMAYKLAAERAGEMARQVYTINFNRAKEAHEAAKPAEAQQWLEHCPSEHRSWEWQHLQYLTSGRGWTRDTGFHRVWWMAISPDRKRVVTVHAVDQPKQQGVLTMIDSRSGEILWQNPDAHSDEANGVSFSHDGKLLVSCADDGLVRLWNSDDGSHIRDFEGFNPDASIIHALFSPDDRLVVAGGGDIYRRGVGDLNIRLWETASGKSVGELEGHTGKIRRMVFSPDGKRLYSCAFDGTFIAWDIATQHQIYRINTGKGVGCIALSPDGTTLATSTQGDNVVKLWHAENGQLIQTLPGNSPLNAIGMPVAFSADGRRLVGGTGDGVVRVWDVETGELLDRLTGHEFEVKGVAFAEGGKSVISADDSGIVLRRPFGDLARNLAQRGETPVLRPDWGGTRSADFSSDGTRFVTGAEDGSLLIWDADTLEPLRRLNTNGDAAARSVAFSPDRQSIACGLSGGTVQLVEVATNNLLWSAGEHGQGSVHVAFSPDAKKVFSIGGDGVLAIWDAQTGQSIRHRKVHEGPVLQLRVSREGLIVTYAVKRSGEIQSSVVVSDSQLELKHQWTSRTRLGMSTGLDISSDGHRVAYAVERRIYLRDLQTGEELNVLNNTSLILALAFTPDDRRLICSLQSGKLQVWDVANGEMTYRLRKTGPAVGAIVLNPSGDQMLLRIYPEDDPVAHSAYLEVVESAASNHPRRRAENRMAMDWLVGHDGRDKDNHIGVTRAELLTTIAEDSSLEPALRQCISRIVSQSYPAESRTHWDTVFQVINDPGVSEETLDRALRWAQAAVHSGTVRSLVRLSYVHEKRGDTDAARQVLQQATAKDPQRAKEIRLAYTRATIKVWWRSIWIRPGKNEIGIKRGRN